MQISATQLCQILPNASPLAGVFIPALNAAMARYQINTVGRAAAFIAQVGHESGQLTRVVENLNYGADGLVKTWPSRFTAELAASVARQPDKIANIVYASRMGNGPEASGDGWRYRGRGLIQVTGFETYQACGASLGLDLIHKPELLEQPLNAALSAGWFWSTKGLNALADADDFESITRKINSGLKGQPERQAFYDLAMQVLA